MVLLLSYKVVCTDPMGRRLRQDYASLRLQLLQSVEGCVPFVVGHFLSPTVVVCVGSLVKLRDQFRNLFEFRWIHISKIPP